jgi:hypothetical protein
MHEQGLIPKPMALETLFPDSTQRRSKSERSGKRSGSDAVGCTLALTLCYILFDLTRSAMRGYIIVGKGFLNFSNRANERLVRPAISQV